MLGFRLDAALSARLQHFSAQSHRSKSDIVRDAMREYLDRHGEDADLQRELAAIAASTTDADLARLDAIHDDLMADEPAYRWARSEA
jgi:predicted transcriptional regulator